MGWIIDLLKDVPLSAVIREKLIDAEKKISVLEQQKEYLQMSFDQATEEIKRLNQIINGMESKKDDAKKHYDAVTDKILKLFFDACRELSVNHVAAALSLDVNTARYHFDLLSQDKLIIRSTAAFESSWTGESSPDMYDLTPLGRKYIIENKTT